MRHLVVPKDGHRRNSSGPSGAGAGAGACPDRGCHHIAKLGSLETWTHANRDLSSIRFFTISGFAYIAVRERMGKTPGNGVREGQAAWKARDDTVHKSMGNTKEARRAYHEKLYYAKMQPG